MEKKTNTECMDLWLEEYREDNSSSTVKGQEYELQTLEYSINKEVSQKGEVSSIARFGMLSVISNNFPTQQLIRWILDIRQFYNGHINVRSDKNALPSENISFVKARCTSLSLHYKSDAPDQIRLSLSIHASTVITNGQKITNY